MKIIVCIKQVPNTSEVKINPETKTLIRDGVESIINPDDKNALEAALRLKDEKGAQVVVLCRQKRLCLKLWLWVQTALIL